MKPIKIILVVALIAVVGDLVIRVTMVERDASREVAREKTARNVDDKGTRNPTRSLPIPSLAPVREPLPPKENKPSSEPLKAASPIQARPQNMTPQSNQTFPFDMEALYAVAREALSWVGADPDADDYWVEAINDPTFSAKQREDLIEDLNEEGFDDPRNPTLAELPMIVNRLALIEDIAGDAMDQVNADAFAEAYKDLLNMYVRLTRR